ncbi:hypothetical protein [Streptomyces sp. NBC_01363]|uniref:hypothetical protein n=1 Tax=Streptomyces sp. NBC_01363 TaxID=2903840 RepID=UPI0022569694|nr:hypothetical protein [Streptomyces sp. NBC_01363]MCX4729840.1 hypothetical protein [Streptomyces sp. NBC_01363]
MHNMMHTAAAALAVVIALGAAAPAASAADANRSRDVSSASAVRAVQVGVALPAGASSVGSSADAGSASPGTQSDVGAKRIGGAAKKLVNEIVKSKYGKAAIKAAKKGCKAFKKWVGSLPNWNPLKWAIKVAPAYVIDEVISYLISNF